MKKTIWFFAALVAAMSSSVACTNSGLKDYYDENGDDPNGDDEGGGNDDPTILSLDECPTMCELQSDSYAYLGCEVDCVVNVDPDFDASLAIVSFPVVIGAGFSWEGGGTCSTVVDCTGQDDCIVYALEVLEETNDNVYSAEQMDNCYQEKACADINDACILTATTANDLCIHDPNHTLEECNDLLQDALSFCTCNYNECISPQGVDCSAETPAPMPPLPTQTAPLHFTVSRRLIDYELGRAMGLYRETVLIPLHNKQTEAWKGMRVRSIEPGDVLYRAGLRNGDVLISANGRAIVDPHAAFSSWLPLRNVPEIRLDIRRQGQNRTLIYTLTN